MGVRDRLGGLSARIWDHPRYPRWLLLNCLAGMFSTTFTATILTVSLTRVAHDLHSTPSTVAWVITAPSLAGAVAMPVLGRLGDIRGHRRVYLTGFSLAIVFSLLTAVARNPLWLIASRTLAQLAGSSTVPASFALLFRAFPPEERVRASAWSSGTLSAAAVTGLVIGGPIIDTIGWRPLFVIQAGLAVAALLPAVLILRPDEERERVPIDKPGAVLLALTAFCATFGLNRITSHGPSPAIVALLVVAPFSLWALVRVERRSASPLLPLGLVRNRNVRLTSAASFALGSCWTGSFVATPLLLESVFRYSATSTSLITMCRTGSIMLAAPVASRLGRRFGERRILVVAAFVTAGGMLLLSSGASAGAVGVVVAALLISGWAWGHAQPAMVAVMANAVDEEDFGLATSLQQTSSQIGSVLSLGLLTAMVADATTRGPFTRGYLVTAGLALVGAAIVTRVRTPERLVAVGLVGEDEIEPVPVTESQFTESGP